VQDTCFQLSISSCGILILTTFSTLSMGLTITLCKEMSSQIFLSSCWLPLISLTYSKVVVLVFNYFFIKSVCKDMSLTHVRACFLSDKHHRWVRNMEYPFPMIPAIQFRRRWKGTKTVCVNCTMGVGRRFAVTISFNLHSDLWRKNYFRELINETRA
jgi:hypothetical protein